MVQMKVDTRQSLPHEVILYIPHGSDESWVAHMIITLRFSFISHMVQMKGAHMALG